MSTTLKNIIILIVLVVLTFVGYKYFYAEPVDKSSNSRPSSQSSNRTSPSDSSSLSDIAIDDGYLDDSDLGTIANDEYLRQLTVVDGIAFNTDLFADDAYKLLKVSNSFIPNEPKGRINPFAPTEQEYGGSPAGSPSAYTNLSLSGSSTRRLPTPPRVR